MEWVGWLSSIILLATIGLQIRKQWKEDSSKGVSKALYVGQLASQVGFVVYSWHVKNWVFVVTNSLLLLENIFGLLIVLRHKRRSPAN